MTIQGITQNLAEFALGALRGPPPDDVRQAAERAILDSLSVAAAGTRHPASRRAIRMVAGLGHTGPCRIFGTAHRTDPVNAALLNGTTAHVLDWDDTILPTRAHLSAALLPPLLAAGELNGWTMDDIIPAFVIGFELSARLNHAVYPAIHNRGWQGTGIVGGIGAAAAVSRAMGLDVTQMTHAMGIAATNGSGLIATFGSMSKALNIGRAAASGLQSALLASLGFTSHADILGTGRFLEMVDDAPRHDILREGLGEQWSILVNGYKLYPCGFVAHASIDAVCDLHSQAQGRTGITKLTLRVSPESMQLMAHAEPTNELEAKFSLLYDAAVAWIEGNVTPAAFEDEAVRDPRYRAVMAVTEIAVSPDIRQDEAFAQADFADGPPIAVHIQHARGTKLRPLTDDDLATKFTAAMAMGGVTDATAIAAMVRRGQTPVAALMESLCKACAA